MTESSPGRQSATDPERLSPQTALIEATQSLEGAALEASLGNIVRLLLESPQGGFFLAGCNFDET